MNLSPSTILQRIPDLRMRVDSTGGAQIFTDGGAIECGSHCLAVLDAFSRPVSLASALEELTARARGTQDWRDLTSTIIRLYRAGVLLDENHARPMMDAEGTGYNAPQVHIEMLNDRARTACFIDAIREVVRPGDVVVEVGTGTGVLSVAAAQAGARHVYAIEASGIGKSARAVFEANGLGNRITLLEGWSTRTTLPERADVMISEMIGNEPLAEQVLEITLDAQKRFLKPDARLVPERVRVFGLPVSIPEDVLAKYTFTEEALSNWRSWYDVDFSPLLEAERNAPHAFYINPYKAREWRTFSEPVLLADLDFKNAKQSVVDNRAAVRATASGRVHGFVVYFELQLGPATRFSTHPAEVDSSNHWLSPVWVLPDSLEVSEGTEMVVEYRHGTVETRHALRVSRA